MSNRYTLAKGEDWEGLYIDGVLLTEGHRLSLRDAFAALCIPVAIIAVVMQQGDSLPMNLADVKEPVLA